MTDITTLAPGAHTIAVDATLASYWLDQHNKRNRAPQLGVVQRYKEDMRAGRWTYTADPIRFSESGVLLDGQHRLMALAGLAGFKMEFLVITGLKDDAQMYMDQGSVRTTGQQLKLAGIRHANHMASIARVYLAWREGSLATTQAITKMRVQEWVLTHDEEIDLLHSNFTTLMNGEVNTSVAGAALLRFAEIDTDAAVQFFKMIASGAGLSERHPVLTLDKKLRRMRRDRLKISHRDELAMVVQAWNKWREGGTMTLFPVPPTGWDRFNFPVPK